MVKLWFGGFKLCNWAGLQAVLTVYFNLATQYGLTKTGIQLKWLNGSPNELEGIYLNYEKTMQESELQTFNTLWSQIATQYTFDRMDTTIRYE